MRRHCGAGHALPIFHVIAKRPFRKGSQKELQDWTFRLLYLHLHDLDETRAVVMDELRTSLNLQQSNSFSTLAKEDDAPQDDPYDKTFF